MLLEGTFLEQAGSRMHEDSGRLELEYRSHNIHTNLDMRVVYPNRTQASLIDFQRFLKLALLLQDLSQAEIPLSLFY